MTSILPGKRQDVCLRREGNALISHGNRAGKKGGELGYSGVYRNE